MILSDQRILDEMEKGTIKIEPYDRNCLGSNSYDVHLGKHLALYVDAELDAKKHNTIAHFDTGAMTNSLVLAAWARGLGAVINGQGIMQSPVVREVAGIPEDQIILTCVALGWPDEEFVANSVVSRRRPISNTTQFLGFDE